ncbi:MAG: bifunctional chorismate mutase/prephenate dehydrogenase [bacterium]|nr:bifunctional chorismate mutase/prephenate dehydrogenase [bacterium]
MNDSQRDDPLAGPRGRIDAIDARILALLAERAELLAEVVATKQREGLPIFVPEREAAKVAAFRSAAVEKGLDPDWAEDFLRMVMGASRARQSTGAFPRAGRSRTILFVGGRGRMGALYAGVFARSGHTVRCLDEGDWDRVDELCAGCDAAVVTVPIRATEAVIARLAPHLGADTLLLDFTSRKSAPLAAMLDAHPGPVVGLHPLHGSDVQNLSKQLMIVCPGRQPEAAAWLGEQFRLWGMRLAEMPAARHDEGMHLVQGLRHFLALLHGSFLMNQDARPQQMLDLSSPIYRAELMMTGRIFAQNPELYADIVFADDGRRAVLLEFLAHHERLAELVRDDDKAGFVAEFERVRAFFGEFAEQALTESNYLIHRLADRFAD